MPTTFRPHPNNLSTQLAAAYTAGSGSLVLAAGTGAAFGSVFPMTITVAAAASLGLPNEMQSIYSVAGRSGDTLTGVAVAEGTTDRNYAAGDYVQQRWTDGLAKSIEGAVNGVENATGITAGTISPARLGTNTAAGNNWLRGDGAWVPQNKAGAYSSTTTIADRDTFVYAAPGGAIILTLPSVANVIGQELIVYNNSSFTVTLQRAGSDTILPGGVTSVAVAGAKYLRLVAINALGWFTVGSN